jgi:hypothetical protein
MRLNFGRKELKAETRDFLPQVSGAVIVISEAESGSKKILGTLTQPLPGGRGV